MLILCTCYLILMYVSLYLSLNLWRSLLTLDGAGQKAKVRAHRKRRRRGRARLSKRMNSHCKSATQRNHRQTIVMERSTRNPQRCAFNFKGAICQNFYVLITFFLSMWEQLVTISWVVYESLQIDFYFKESGCFCQENQKMWSLHACLRASCNECLYNVQINAKRAILYCNVNISCKEKGLIQTIVSQTDLYSLQSQVYFMIKLSQQCNFNNLIYRHDAGELSLCKPIHNPMMLS